jgi:cell division protein DivIC
MERKNVFRRILNILKNKYFIVTVIFLIYITLLSQNNLIDKFLAIQNLHKLKKEKEYYINDIKSTNKKLSELRKDKKNIANIEKFAREQYLMKKDNEDLYLVVDKTKK